MARPAPAYKKYPTPKGPRSVGTVSRPYALPKPAPAKLPNFAFRKV